MKKDSTDRTNWFCIQSSVLYAVYINATLQIIVNDIRAFFEFYDKNNQCQNLGAKSVKYLVVKNVCLYVKDRHRKEDRGAHFRSTRASIWGGFQMTDDSNAKLFAAQDDWVQFEEYNETPFKDT